MISFPALQGGAVPISAVQAGFKIAAALEISPLRCEVYEDNLKIRPIQQDIMKTSGKQILQAAKIREGEKFCIVGCPPCQSFSKLSDTTLVDVKSDPRSRYVEKFASIVTETRPTAVVFENVFWMTRGPGKVFFERYLNRLKRIGYEMVYNTINAVDYNIPQNRNRVIAISIKRELATAQVKSALEKFLHAKKRKYRTVRDAIKDLRPLGAGKTDPDDHLHFSRRHDPRVLRMIRAVPKNGGKRTQMPRRLWLKCHKRIRHGADSVYGRMWWDRPAPTMTCRCTTPACGRFIHPTQDRGISIREAMRLQTIPDSFRMAGNRQRSEEMIGDAVPVHLAKRIGQKLLEVLP